MGKKSKEQLDYFLESLEHGGSMGFKGTKTIDAKILVNGDDGYKSEGDAPRVWILVNGLELEAKLGDASAKEIQTLFKYAREKGISNNKM